MIDRRLALGLAGLLVLLAVLGAQEGPDELAPLPALEAPNPAQAKLGEMLFFDLRLSGDATLSCATCHDPAQGWADGLALSKGYPGSLYFRNAPTVVNAVHGRYAYWDGRLPASDMPTVVRDHIAEAHFMQADGRLVLERLRQVPAYERMFREAFGSEPSYGGVLKAVTAYLKTLRSADVPFDRYLAGDKAALSAEAKRGLALFRGKAGCVRCHHGPMLSDGGYHNLGLAPNAAIFREPERHITFRRFLKTLGVREYAKVRQDVGLYAVTKRDADRGRFRTPTLREVSRTAPYMHDGSLATLADVVAFYDRGGGPAAGKDPSLAPLGLSAGERADLVAFLESLAGKPIPDPKVKLPEYELRKLGEN